MKFSIIKKGYDPEEVDEYVTKTETILDGYRKREAVISNSIISAEMSKNKIIKEAEEEARKIIDGANTEVAEQLDAIKKMLTSEKKALEDFCGEYDSVVKNYFTATAVEVTAPLKEKLLALESIVNELDAAKEEAKAESDGPVAETSEATQNNSALKEMALNEPAVHEPNFSEPLEPKEIEPMKINAEGDSADPFGEIKNYF